MKDKLATILLNLATKLIANGNSNLAKPKEFMDDVFKIRDILYKISTYERFTDTYLNMYMPKIDENYELIFRKVKKDVFKF